MDLALGASCTQSNTLLLPVWRLTPPCVKHIILWGVFFFGGCKRTHNPFSLWDMREGGKARQG